MKSSVTRIYELDRDRNMISAYCSCNQINDKIMKHRENYNKKLFSMYIYILRYNILQTK